MFLGAIDNVGLAFEENALGTSTVDPGSLLLDYYLGYQWVLLTGKSPDVLNLDQVRAIEDTTLT